MSDEQSEPLDAMRPAVRRQARPELLSPSRLFWRRGDACAALAALARRSVGARSLERGEAVGAGGAARPARKLASGHFGNLRGDFRPELLGIIPESAENASGKILEWDYADQMRHVDKGNNTGQHTYFVYDATGERIRKVYVHNGYRDERIYLGGYELWRRRNSTTLALIDERQTVHIADDQRRVAMVETLTVSGGNTVTSPTPRLRYQLDDHLGTACVEVDGSAAVISFEEYHPFGTSSYRSFQSSEVSAKRYRYTGKERDEETGLAYHGARYYCPWLGRWTSADPAGLVDGPNLYGYCRGDPIGGSDPSGLGGQKEWTETPVSAEAPVFHDEPPVKSNPPAPPQHEPDPSVRPGLTEADARQLAGEGIRCGPSHHGGQLQSSGADPGIDPVTGVGVLAYTLVAETLVALMGGASTLNAPSEGEAREAAPSRSEFNKMATTAINVLAGKLIGKLLGLFGRAKNEALAPVGGAAPEVALPGGSPRPAPAATTLPPDPTPAPPPAAPAGAAMRRVGDLLQTADDVLANPSLLEGQGLADVKLAIGGTPNWVNDVMRHSTTHPRGGWMFREMNAAGTDFTGRLIEFHPGTRRHFGGLPYWKVSGIPGKAPVRIPLAP